MKKLLTFIALIITLYGCSSSKQVNQKKELTSTNEKQDTIRIVNEELEYEIIILDVGFDSWLVTQKPMSYYSNQTLRVKNIFYVSEWNQRVSQPFRYNIDLYQQTIDYDPNIDYGLEVNYLLYQYFQFFQKKYNQRL
jgi:hypothetical protein